MARAIRDPGARQRIIDSACRTIAEHGIRGATMRTISAEAGVSTGYVTHYFADKDELTAEVLTATNLRAGQRAMAASSAVRGIEAIAAAVDAVLPVTDEQRVEWGVWVAYWSEAAGDPEAARALDVSSQVLGAILALPFAEAVEDGQLPPGLDVTYETRRLLLLAAGLGLYARVSDPDEIRTFARRVLRDHLAQLRFTTPDAPFPETRTDHE